MGAGGAGRRRRLVRSFGVIADAHMSGGKVNDGCGNEKGRDLARTAVDQVGMFALDDVESADAGADVYAHTLRDFGGDV